MQETEQKGKIIRGVGGLYTVLTENGTEISCRAKGVLKRDENKALVGDNVSVLTGDTPDSTVISEIFPRRNSLIRPPIANLDTVLLTAASTHPAPVYETLDKMTAILVHNRIRPVIVVTKNELSPESAEEIRRIYENSGFTVLSVSSFSGAGVAELSDFVKSELTVGHVIAFAGASGVGKSTVLNRLFPDLQLSTGDISHRIERGKHTTRTVELFPMFGGFVADTPGFSMIDFTRFDFMKIEDLTAAFPEFFRFTPDCRYADCTHTKEEECGVRAAVKSGSLAPSRFESYRSIYDAIKARDPYK